MFLNEFARTAAIFVKIPFISFKIKKKYLY